MSICLAIDIGNSCASIAVCKNGKTLRHTKLETAEQTSRSVDSALRQIVKNEQMDGAIISSVVPQKTDQWMAAARKITFCHPVILSAKLKLNIKLDYPKPLTIGTDRIANACQGYRKFGGPVIVIDIGTATTADIVTKDGRFIGGCIVPGPIMMLRALSSQTALLPQVGWAKKTPKIGRNTETAMQMGVQASYPAMIAAIVSKLKDYIGEHNSITTCVTGGYAKTALSENDSAYEFDQFLTLEGLAYIWSLNS